MTLKQLEAFYWAATCINFAVAAERVHISSSSLSKRISELEFSLGLPLFDKNGRNSILTAHGERLLPHAKDLLDLAGRIRETLGSTVGLVGHCRIGMGEMSALCWLPRFVATMFELHPGLQIQPQVAHDQVLERRLEDGELDCAVLAAVSSRGALASQPITEARLVWVASKEFVEIAGTLRPEEMVNRHLFISLPSGSGPTRALDQWSNRYDVTVNRRLSCNNWGAVVGMIRAGLGFGFMPSHWASTLQKKGALTILSNDEDILGLRYVLQWRRDDSRELIGEVRKIIDKVAEFNTPDCFT